MPRSMKRGRFQRRSSIHKSASKPVTEEEVHDESEEEKVEHLNEEEVEEQDASEDNKMSEDEKSVSEESNPSEDKEKMSEEENAEVSAEDGETDVMNFEDVSSDDEAESGSTMMDKTKLEELKEKDPDFYQFMLKNDPKLFSIEKETDAEMGWAIDNEAQIEQEAKEKIQEVLDEAEKGDPNALHQATLLFYDAVQERRIDNPADYELVMTFAIEKLPELVINKVNLFKMYMRGVTDALLNISDQSIVTIFIQIIEQYKDKFAACDFFAKVIKSLSLYGFDYFADVRSQALITLLNLMEINKKKDEAFAKGLRVIIGSFMENAKRYSELTKDGFEESNSVVQKVVKMNEKAAYNSFFEVIRQLGLSTNSVIESAKSKMDLLVSFSFIKTIELIASCLNNGKEVKFVQLKYPVCEIINAVLSYLNGTNYTPAILHISKVLLMLATPQNYTSPVPYLLKALNFLSMIYIRGGDIKTVNSTKLKAKDIKNKIGGTFGKAELSRNKTKAFSEFEFEYSLMSTNDDERNPSYVKNATDIIFKQFDEFYAIYKHSIAFPELVCNTVKSLKKIIRSSKIVFLVEQCKVYVAKLMKMSDAVKAKRKNVSFGPFDLNKVDEFEKEF
ncbi:nucleolar complex protein, putative [Entamoeba invadens IP1]|uniref:Nucleolar complex protein, putative n=1 Tax=Entamoeba invadens IP1 TaxID=370355 RepID=A0A0A1U3Q5_ENTIV|nr:nucleolar complex protein, putative [Entamoeba invadens IP1]ELP87358.1 nucleolar complex protein, putative [Entamoeba invadens IP1]|eukprot:XP_004254129.1 nucleolar complex protein, putative [Entamoeba invadens IP1]